MPLEIVGEDPLVRDDQGRFKNRVATLFLQTGALVTVSGTHGWQRLHYAGLLDQQRRSRGEPVLSEAERNALWDSGVDLFVDSRGFLIRPDPGNLPPAFEADRLLQSLISKCAIRFLGARHEKVRQAMRQRGEYWRVNPVPQSPARMEQAIAESRIALGGRALYHYNPTTGTRYLTLGDFASLAGLPDAERRALLAEIRCYAAQRNLRHQREVELFAGDDATLRALTASAIDLDLAGEAELLAWHARVADLFRQAVPAELRDEHAGNLAWRNRMFDRLTHDTDDTMVQEMIPGTTPEFFRQIRWLPGGRVEQGELMFDDIFAEAERHPQDLVLRELCDIRVRGMVCNYVRQFGALEYVNIGLLAPEMRRRPSARGRRAYIAEVKHRGAPAPVVHIIRLQTWGIREHLDAGKDLLRAIMEAEDYTEYILDRRLGCWELGMPLPGRIETYRIAETYRGANKGFHGTRIWTTYFERDFLPGLATDKILPEHYRDPRFALACAGLLGQAAAPNLAVGRTTEEGAVIFDDGDEILVLNPAGEPQRLVVADHAGTFRDFTSELETFARAYAGPVLHRVRKVPDAAAFARAYLDGFAGRFRQMQETYRLQRRAFDTLFQHSKPGEGAFSWRWARVLARMDRTDAGKLCDRIRAHIEAGAGVKL